jgi:hypothetical protein
MGRKAPVELVWSTEWCLVAVHRSRQLQQWWLLGLSGNIATVLSDVHGEFRGVWNP